MPSFLVGLTVLAAVIGAGLSAVSKVLEGQTRRLSDGSSLQLAEVSYERRHSLPDRTWWQKLLGPLLAPQWQSGGGYSFDSDRDELAFLLFRRALPGARQWQGCAVTAEDEHGCQVGRGAAMTVPALSSGTLRSRTATIGSLDAFPRRAGAFRLRVFPDNLNAPAAEFRVANPKPGPYPTWTPVPLPITARQGALQVTLTALRTGLSWSDLLHSQPALSPAELRNYLAFTARYPPWNSKLPAPWETRWTRASFRILDRGQPSRDWQLDGVSVADATGNLLSYRVQDLRTCLRGSEDGAGRLWFAFHSGLCTHEPAWKVRAHVAHVGPPAALQELRSADLRWTVRHVPVPASGHSASLEEAVNQHEVTLRPQAVSTPDATAPNRPPAATGTIYAHIQIHRPPRQRLRLLAQAADENGRAPGPPSSVVFTGSESEWRPTLQVPRGANAVTVTFALWKERVFEYLVKPAS